MNINHVALRGAMLDVFREDTIRGYCDWDDVTEEIIESYERLMAEQVGHAHSWENVMVPDGGSYREGRACPWCGAVE